MLQWGARDLGLGLCLNLFFDLGDFGLDVLDCGFLRNLIFFIFSLPGRLGLDVFD